MTELNTLIPANSPLFLIRACAINSSGQIIGVAVTSAGEAHGYLATSSNLLPTGVTTGNAISVVVTPFTLTTSQSSVVLDASGSTSGAGSLTYQFTVVPGGKQPA